jgi:NAD(P)-dependent dehydrogenase (short-subunit alcohol dehydrogenase family)
MAVFLLSKLAARSMVNHKGGKIINIGSMYSFLGSALVPSYAAKGAIVQLTKSMAIELASHKIQVNAIAPGWIETDMTVPVRAMPMNDEIIARPPRRSMGATGGNWWNGGVPGLTCFGLRHRHNNSRRWRLCDPMRPSDRVLRSISISIPGGC